MTTVTRVTSRVMPVRDWTVSTAYGRPGPAPAERTHVFVRVETSAGVAGIAEGSPLPHFTGEYAELMAQLIDQKLGPALIGQEVFELESIHRQLARITAGHHASKSAIINAVVDAQGRLLELPATSLFGGALCTALPIAGLIGLEDIPVALAQARDFVAAGIRTIKLKIGIDPSRDIRLIAEFRREFGPAVELRADANGAFSRGDARRFVHLVEPYGLQYLEQPLPPADLSGLAELRRFGSVPIAVDESLYSLQDAAGIIRQDAADVFIIKLIKLGGIHVARKVAALAEGAGIDCVAVSPYETGVGASSNLHLACSSPAFRWAVEVAAGPLAVEVPGIPSLDYRDGQVRLPAGPGFGIQLCDRFFERASLIPDGDNVD